jgi:hypothetical protein
MSNLVSSGNPDGLGPHIRIRSSDQDVSGELGPANQPVHRIQELYRVLPVTSTATADASKCQWMT